MRLSHALVVTDRDDWARRAVEIGSAEGLAPERVRWEAPTRRRRVPLATLLDVRGGFTEKLGRFERWAEWAWQPICVASVSADRGAAEFVARLEELGHERIRYEAGGTDWDGIASDMREVLAGPAWLVTQVAAALDCSDRKVLRALELALGLIPERVTIESWASALELGDRRRLDELFADLQLPTPKRVFDWLRVGKGYVLQARTPERLIWKQLAGELGYSSGRYFGRRTKDLSGLPPGSLTRLEPDEFVELMRRRLRAGPK